MSTPPEDDLPAPSPRPTVPPPGGRVTPESERHNPLTEPVKYLTDPIQDPLRPHVYDGIQEYDKRLPHWWLITLYGTIVFSLLYWAYVHAYGFGTPPHEAVEEALAENKRSAQRKAGVIDDDALWRLSQDSGISTSGKATFDTTCASCHKPDLTGLIGPNLADREWIHGGTPMEVLQVITKGVLDKGMPAWGSVLGQQKITEVTAFIFSKHQSGEPIVPVKGWTIPGAATPPPPAP